MASSPTLCTFALVASLETQHPTTLILAVWTSDHIFLRVLGNLRGLCQVGCIIWFIENASFFPRSVLLHPLTVTAGGLTGMNRLGRKSTPHHTHSPSPCQPPLHCVIGRDGRLPWRLGCTEMQIMWQGFYYSFTSWALEFFFFFCLALNQDLYLLALTWKKYKGSGLKDDIYTVKAARSILKWTAEASGLLPK